MRKSKLELYNHLGMILKQIVDNAVMLNVNLFFLTWELWSILFC
jgi:hypothetical protein